MNKEKYIVSKTRFLLTFIMAIVVYALSLILNIASLIVAIERLSKFGSSYWFVYANIVLSMLFSLGALLSSTLIFTRTKEKDKGGQILITFICYFLLIVGVCSFISGMFYVVSNAVSNGVINRTYGHSSIGICLLVFSTLQITLCATSFNLSKKNPKIARIVLIGECLLFAISNFLNMTFYVKFDSYIDIVVCLIIFAFNVAIIFVLIMMKIKNEEGTENTLMMATNTNAPLTTTNAPLAEKKTSEEEKLTLLLKYKDLLDKGVITQEEFDAKKKELL